MKTLNITKFNLLIVVIALVPCLAQAQSSDSVLTRLGQWGWGPCDGVAVKGNYAYIGNGAMLQVLDITHPRYPIPVGQLLTNGPVSDVVVSGNYAYTLKPFRIIDISNPTLPRLISTFSPSSVPLTTMTVRGNYVYAGNMSGAIYIIDVSNPYQPKVVNPAMSVTTSGEFVESIVVSGKNLYASSYDGHSLDIYDVSNPTNPISLGHPFDIFGGTAMAVDGDHLFIGTQSSQLQVYDLRNPANPRYITAMSLRTTGTSSAIWTYAISVVNKLAYLSTSDGFRVVDIADTSNVKTVAEMHAYLDRQSGDSVKFGSGSQFITSDYAYLTTGRGLLVVSTDNPGSLETDAFFGTGLEAVNIATDSSDHAFIAELSGGLKIVDFSNPSSPQLVGQYNPDESVRYVVVRNHFAYLLCDSDIRVLDISELGNPRLVARLHFRDTLNDNNGVFEYGCMIPDDSTLFIARNSDMVYAVDIQDPYHPRAQGTYLTRGVPFDIAAYGNFLYVAEVDTGIQIFDQSGPGSLSGTSFTAIVPLSGFSLIDNRLFVVGFEGTILGEAALAEFTLSDSTDPRLVTTWNIPGGITTVYADDDRDFVYFSYNQNLLGVNLENPDSAKVLSLANAASYGVLAFGPVAVSNGIILLGIRDQGVLVLSNSLDTTEGYPPASSQNFKLFQNYPNPFNPGTHIMFQSKVESQITIDVYNILGERVLSRDLGVLQAGTYRQTLDMHQFASGVYFCRVEAVTSDGRKLIQTRKMELLK
ncbi:MAG: T9SS type A sorting domain-containing protein [Bacteroidetes bacterium]|nr:T9SS type A sorting domain-containing protein [Bacteroidota bacterium]